MQVPWNEALRNIVRSCYRHFNAEHLLTEGFDDIIVKSPGHVQVPINIAYIQAQSLNIIFNNFTEVVIDLVRNHVWESQRRS